MTASTNILVGVDAHELLSRIFAGSHRGGNIELICRADNALCIEAAVMRQERIDAVVNASVALEIGAQAALVQGQAQLAAVDADAVLAVVENGNAEAGLGEVGIFMVEHLELCLFNAVVAGGRALDIAELDIEAGELLPDRSIERSLEEAVVILQP